jgi:hypothetical protein
MRYMHQGSTTLFRLAAGVVAGPIVADGTHVGMAGYGPQGGIMPLGSLAHPKLVVSTKPVHVSSDP